MPVTFSLSPCVHSPHQLTELLALGSVHLMGENSLIKKGVKGAELWERSIGWSVQPAPPHLPNCSCLSVEKNPFNSRCFAQSVTDTVVRHFSSNKSVSIRNSMQEQDRPLQHRPLQAPDPWKNQQFSYHVSTIAVSGAAQAEGHHWNASVGRGKFEKGKKMALLPSTLYLTEEGNRKKDASCFDSCSQFNVSSKVNILS